MNRVVSVLCIVAASIFATLAAFVLVTKMASLSVRTVLYLAAFVVAAVACWRAAVRLRRPTRRDVAP